MIPTRRQPEGFAGSLAPAAAAAARPDGAASLPSLAAPTLAGLRTTVLDAVLRAVEAVATWQDRARQRRSLLQLSDEMLRDIGISRAQAHGEADKPFWRV